MAIHENVILYIAECDNCHEQDEGSDPGFETGSEAIDEAVADGWKAGGDNYILCPACSK